MRSSAAPHSASGSTIPRMRPPFPPPRTRRERRWLRISLPLSRTLQPIAIIVRRRAAQRRDDMARPAREAERFNEASRGDVAKIRIGSDLPRVVRAPEVVDDRRARFAGDASAHVLHENVIGEK